MGKMRRRGLDRSGDYPGGPAQSRMAVFAELFRLILKRKRQIPGLPESAVVGAFASRLEVEMQSVLDLTGVADQTARGAESRL